jgi:hypothetical protein
MTSQVEHSAEMYSVFLDATSSPPAFGVGHTELGAVDGSVDRLGLGQKLPHAIT